MSAPDVLQLSLNIMWEQDVHYNFINGLRTQYTPPDLLWNGAHLSLFARLNVPPAMVARVCADLAKVARSQKVFDMDINTTLKLSKNYIIISVNSANLLRIRATLKNKWASSEIVNYPERKHVYAPHVTVCGKGLTESEAELAIPKARADAKEHRRAHGNLHAKAVGLQLVNFLPGEQWRVIQEFRFKEPKPVRQEVSSEKLIAAMTELKLQSDRH